MRARAGDSQPGLSLPLHSAVFIFDYGIFLERTPDSAFIRHMQRGQIYFTPVFSGFQHRFHHPLILPEKSHRLLATPHHHRRIIQQLLQIAVMLDMNRLPRMVGKLLNQRIV